MELKEAIYGRRSVRKYSDRMVEDDVLKEIMEAAMWAPSGVNLQPWYYVVVRTPESMARFRQVMTKVSEGNRAHLEERFAAHPEVAESSIAFIRNMGNAPVAVQAFRDKPDYSWALQDEGIVQSIAASMENLLLSAYDHGVSSCWLTAPAQAHMTGEIRDESAPGHGELVAIAVLGYAADGFNPKAPKRKEGKYTFI